MRESGSFAFVQIQLTTTNGRTQSVVGLLSDIGLISEVAGVVGLELKLESPTDSPAQIGVDSTPEVWLTLDQIEKDYLARVLEHTHGNKQAAARILGIDRTTVNRKITHYKIDVSAFLNGRGKLDFCAVDSKGDVPVAAIHNQWEPIKADMTSSGQNNPSKTI
jgi:hypothetical protein